MLSDHWSAIQSCCWATSEKGLSASPITSSMVYSTCRHAGTGGTATIFQPLNVPRIMRLWAARDKSALDRAGQRCDRPGHAGRAVELKAVYAAQASRRGHRAFVGSGGGLKVQIVGRITRQIGMVRPVDEECIATDAAGIQPCERRVIGELKRSTCSRARSCHHKAAVSVAVGLKQDRVLAHRGRIWIALHVEGALIRETTIPVRSS